MVKGLAVCTQELVEALSRVCLVVRLILVVDELDEFESGNGFRASLEPSVKTKRRSLVTTRSLPKECLELNSGRTGG